MHRPLQRWMLICNQCRMLYCKLQATQAHARQHVLHHDKEYTLTIMGNSTGIGCSTGSRDTLSMKWHRQHRRLEDWYAITSDPTSRSGCWMHNKLISPAGKVGKPFIHGWATLFRKEQCSVMECYDTVGIDGKRSSWDREGRWILKIVRHNLCS
jgi:hypothetical protein